MPTISRQEHAALFGPTVGDKIRLGDTDLFVEIEKDLRHYGDESFSISTNKIGREHV